MENEIQDYPTVDSITTEPLENLVEMYYQLNGYITSTNKWFWVYESSKKQRGYKDIDILAIKGNETLIISVTTNLDDKVGNANKIEELKKYFDSIKSYLEKVKEYSWLVEENGRTIKKIVAYAYGYKEKKEGEIKKELEKDKIDLLSVKDIMKEIKTKINKMHTNGLKTNNSLVKMIQIWIEYSKKQQKR